MTPAELKAGREAAGMDRETLGRAVGKSKRQVYRWEAGESPIGQSEEIALRSVLAPHATLTPRNGSARQPRRKANRAAA